MTSLKLLVVEDDLASLELMVEVFTSLKAEVHPVSDSEKAVDMINQGKFDGIFLDLEMPNINGYDLLVEFEVVGIVVVTAGRDHIEVLGRLAVEERRQRHPVVGLPGFLAEHRDPPAALEIVIGQQLDEPLPDHAVADDHDMLIWIDVSHD